MVNLGSLLSSIFATDNKKKLKEFSHFVTKINALEEQYSCKNHEQILKDVENLKNKSLNGHDQNELISDSFAVVREAAKRTLKQRHFDVQLMGGLVLHHGGIAEMKTGEGKTLVSTLAAFLNSLSGNGVHIVTVNDYLAKRDSEWMGQIFKYLGLSVGCLTNDLVGIEARKEMYNCDITYGTNNEFGFDYLRDNLKAQKKNIVQRGHHFCIVDEVDSILIDESRTPLVISGATEDKTNLYNTIDRFIPFLDQ
ncbi:uncharacterized protein METZ01_LOCUS313908, partial [marine metagenome]